LAPNDWRIDSRLLIRYVPAGEPASTHPQACLDAPFNWTIDQLTAAAGPS
jgi:hypothetical protein